MPKIEEHAKNILTLRKGEKFPFWVLHKNMDMICFSAIMFVSTTLPIVLCMYNFVLNHFDYHQLPCCFLAGHSTAAY